MKKNPKFHQLLKVRSGCPKHRYFSIWPNPRHACNKLSSQRHKINHVPDISSFSGEVHPNPKFCASSETTSDEPCKDGWSSPITLAGLALILPSLVAGTCVVEQLGTPVVVHLYSVVS